MYCRPESVSRNRHARSEAIASGPAVFGGCWANATGNLTDLLMGAVYFARFAVNLLDLPSMAPPFASLMNSIESPLTAPL